MDRCECYKWGERFECRYYEDGRPYGIMVGYNYCSSTKECDACSCGGDKTKCDFYPDIKRKAIYKLKGIKTNADRIRSMSDEELAELMDKATDYFNCDECEFRHLDDCGTSLLCQRHILKWLQEEIK